MAYEPKEWACGDVVTADALNHIEQGIAEAGGGGASLVIQFTQKAGAPTTETIAGGEQYTFECEATKTFDEVYEYITNGGYCVGNGNSGVLPLKVANSGMIEFANQGVETFGSYKGKYGYYIYRLTSDGKAYFIYNSGITL